MALLGLALVVLWILLVSVIPTTVRLRANGRPVVRFTDPRGSAQWSARLMSSVGFVCAVVAPLAELAGLRPFGLLDAIGLRLLGVALVLAGIALNLVSQRAMGDAWRADVDPDARTALVTGGPFGIVRNPTLLGTAITSVGLALVVPNAIALAMLIAFLVALQIQVRLVEEPYLRRVHGETWLRYAARTGRFLPFVGRQRTGPD